MIRSNYLEHLEMTREQFSVRSRYIFLMLVFSMLLLPTAELRAQSASPAAKKYALLVAVSHYEAKDLNTPPLKYPEADAIALQKVLEENGYTVETLLGPRATQSEIRARLKALSQKGNDEGAVVVGFFGHGVEFEGTSEAMFCPYGTSLCLAQDKDGKPLYAKDASGTPLREPDRESLIKMSEILNAITLTKAGNRLLLADCCRTRPNTARGRAFGSSVKLSDLPGNTAAIFACAEGEEAQEDDSWQHGALTKCFLDLLPELASDAQDVAAITGRLRRNVATLVNSATGGKKKQTVQPLVNGVVELRLSGKTVQPLANGVVEHPLSGKTVLAEGRQAKEIHSDNDLSLKLVWIPAGSFTMGSPVTEKDRKDNEAQVSVTLARGFWMGETEVTQEQWQRLMRSTPWQGKDHVKEGKDFPATYISHGDDGNEKYEANSASEFCRLLTEKELAAGRVLRGWAYALPTEAQWEYACRAGKSTRFSFGADDSNLGRYAWFSGNAWAVDEKYAHQVLQKLPNAFGLYDMHGNVWEWCRDAYKKGLTGGVDPFVATGRGRVFRGGGFGNTAVDCRSSHRYGGAPGNRDNFIGFRVVLRPTGH
jgi:formylglycine-generating enzyme required for sulfatase activity